MKLRKKRGFTIVEMLMVIAVLAVLTGIVATAATSVIRKSRERKTEALRAALQTGIATYYQQEGCWPPDRNGSANGKLQKWANDGLDSSARSRKWSNGGNVSNLEPDEYDELMQFLVVRCLNASGNPIMDVSGFTATLQDAAKKMDKDENPTCFGEEVRSWVAKQRAGSGAKSNRMTFGYSNSRKGLFRRFIISYNADSDSVSVGFAQKNVRLRTDKQKYETIYDGDDDK